MILVDTSVWVDHFKIADPAFSQLSPTDLLLIHPFVLGELALGTFVQRQPVLRWLGKLMPATVAKHDEVLEFIETNKLYGAGVGLIDIHLLASVRLTKKSRLWTRDKKLKAAAQMTGTPLVEENLH
jgi:predicted nucleic acid-binding protein